MEQQVFKIRQNLLPTRARLHQWGMAGSRKCRYCKQQDETIDHLTSGCSCFSFSRYVTRHDTLCKAIHWAILRKYGGEGERATAHWQHKPTAVTNVGGGKLIWNQFVPVSSNAVKANRPDIVWEEGDTIRVIEISCPADRNVREMTNQKDTKYVSLIRDIHTTRGKRVEYYPIVIGATGAITERCAQAIDDLGLEVKLEWLQKLVTYETVKILTSLV